MRLESGNGNGTIKGVLWLDSCYVLAFTLALAGARVELTGSSEVPDSTSNIGPTLHMYVQLESTLH